MQRSPAATRRWCACTATRKKALAFTADVTPRYCLADPFEGGKQAVAEAYRNLTATGAQPLAVTDNLNFASPERPEIMGQFVGCVQGIGEACRALDFPVVSGNVSLYNETDGKPILPTPTIGGVGLLADHEKMLTIGGAKDGDALILIGETKGHLGQSLFLAHHGIEEGDAPHVDLAAERKAGDLVRSLSAADIVGACHDLSDGGLAVAAAEMALAADLGVNLSAPDDETPAPSWFFGEDQGRYLLAVAPSDRDAVIAAAQGAGVTARAVGAFGGATIKLGDDDVPLADLRDAHEGWFESWLAEA